MPPANLDIALRLPNSEVDALIEGRIITVIPRIYLDPGRQFALYPDDVLNNSLASDKYYNSAFLPITEKALIQESSETALIKAWAKCEFCQMLNDAESLKGLSRLTIWTTESLQQILLQRPYIFLAYLRVYLLPDAIEMPLNKQERQFVALPKNLAVTESSPVLTERTFSQRRQQLEKLEPPQHPELEELQSALALLANTNPAAKEFDRDLKIFLGWSSHQLTQQLELDLAWVNDIAALGNRSKEEDDGRKINWQAGTDFENIVRQSLEFLGFTIDYSHKGGAGGLDLFCSKPYPLVGECKAGKKIPNDTAVQLLNLGTLRLQNQEMLQQAVKLIIGPGEPTPQLKDAANVHNMAIINPETLEKLVKLQSQYRNSVDLFKLKEYLKPGKSDDEVQKYIEQVYQEILLRSHIVASVNQLHTQGSKQPTVTEIRTVYNTKFAHDPSFTLNDELVHDLLVELSSPLTGYLGRIKGIDAKSDRFYFLRDLSIAPS